MPDKKTPRIGADFRATVQDITRHRHTVKIVPNKESFQRAAERLKPYKSLPEKMRPALEGLAEYVRTVMIPETFRSEGPGWAPLAPRTIAERMQGGFSGPHPILFRTGDLYAELTERAHPSHIEIVKVGKEARVEIGGSSQKFIENQMGVSPKAPSLPKRAMIPGTGNIPIDQRHKLEMQNIIKRTVRGR